MKALLSVVLPILSAGCGIGTLSLSREEHARVLESRIHVLATAPRKRICLREHLYRVGSKNLEERHYRYDGLWDPAPELEDLVCQALETRFGLKATSVRRTLDPAGIADPVGSAETAFRDALESGEESRYLHAPPPEALRALGSKQIRYLLEVALTDIVVERWGLDLGLEPPRYQVVVMARLIRVLDGEVVWLQEGRDWVRIPSFDSFIELQKDAFRPLRELFPKGVAALCSPENRFLGEFGSFEEGRSRR